MSGKTLLIITAGTCGACSNLKSNQNYSAIRDVYTSNGVKIKEQECRSTAGFTGNESGLVPLSSVIVRWFPMFVLVDDSLLNLNRQQLTADLIRTHTKVFNGVFSGSDYRRVPNNERRNLANVADHKNFLAEALGLSNRRTQIQSYIEANAQSNQQRSGNLDSRGSNQVCSNMVPSRLYEPHTMRRI